MDLLTMSTELVSSLDRLSTLCTLAAATGLLSHILYYIRGYRVPQTVPIIFSHLATGILVYAASIYRLGPLTGLGFGLAVNMSYLSALFTSVTIYRIWFHRLSSFPGPFWAKVSKMYVWYLAQDGKLHEHQLAWTRKYGPIVRVAPNELLIASVDSLGKIHAASAKSSKRGTFYDYINYNGEYNLDSILDREPHRWRRQVWDKGMMSKSQKQYELNTRGVVHDWLDQLAKREGKPVNTSLFSLLIPFDVMGKMGYSKDFGTVKAGVENHMLEMIETTFRAIGLTGTITWPIDLSARFKLGKEQIEFEKMASDMVDERLAVDGDGQEREDLLKYFLDDYRADKPKSFFNRNILDSDSQIVIIGGTDTIAVALSHAFYHLARDPLLQQRVRDEISAVYGKMIPGEFAHDDLRDLPVLNSVIDETLRMHTPTLNNGVRNVPPEGISIEGRYIPGGISVWPGIWATHRNPAYFKQVDEFIPERWTTRPDLVIDKRAFHPFGSGPFNCVGQRAALMVLRLTLSYTVQHYDFTFAPGEDGTCIFSECFNQLILKAGPLECVFTKRV